MSFNAEEKLSYMAANVFPVKVLKHPALLGSIRQEKRILPIHVQLNPTNLCNLSCSFCSCSNRKRDLMLPASDVRRIMSTCASLGCKSVTLTGGGEVLLHEGIREILSDISGMGIEIGLVTNGTMLKRLRPEDLHRLVWCRISSSDSLESQLTNFGASEGWFKEVEHACNQASVDWAFSHVLTRTPNYPFIQRIVDFANDHQFTHVRIVSDLLDVEAVPRMKEVQARMRDRGVDDRRVIYQGRKHYTPGCNPCYISLLKPVIGADGGLWPCCGVQYSLPNPSRDYEPTMKMGNIADLPRLIRKQEFFDGSNCVRCYYSEYNNLLKLLLSDVEHLNFV